MSNRLEYKYEHDLLEFVKNKQNNVNKLVEAANNRHSSYIFDQDYMFVVNRNIRTITTWYMGMHKNIVVWKIGY